MARLFHLPSLWLSLGPLRSFFPGFLQLHVATGKWANPEGPPRSPLPTCQVDVNVLDDPGNNTLKWERFWQPGSLSGRGEQSTTCPPPGLHQTRNCLYMKSLKPPGFPFTAASMTLTNKSGETRGKFLKLSPCDHLEFFWTWQHHFIFCYYEETNFIIA